MEANSFDTPDLFDPPVSLSHPQSPTDDFEIANVLDDMFRLCRLPFVLDFLFTSDAVADITMLTSPVQTEHAIAARIQVSGSQIRTAASVSRLVDYSADLYYSSVPAFSVDGITLGFCTSRPVRRTDPSRDDATTACFATHSHPHYSRFVRDDMHAVMLTVTQNAPADLVEIDCVTHRSTRDRIRVSARFCASALLPALRAARASSVLQASLRWLSVAVERRPCPICARQTLCSCPLPVHRPAHPLDFRHERANMTLHAGAFYGSASVRVFVGDGHAVHPCRADALRTRVVIQGCDDAAVVRLLCSIAVRERLSTLRVHPLATTMSAAAALPTEDVSAMLANKAGVGTIISPWLIASANSPLHDPDRANANLIPSRRQGDSLDSLFAAVDAERESGVRAISNAKTDLGVHADVGIGRAMNAGMNVVGGKTAKMGYAEQINRGNVEVYDYGEIGDENEDEDADVDGGGDGVGDEGRLLRAEVRKQRNRVAAAKSNLKRKIRNQNLRRDLADVQQRAKDLQEVEKKLRSENVRLRILAQNLNMSVTAHLTHITI